MTTRAGMASSRIDVPTGLPMDGYGARSSPAEGTRDPLEATALYVADENRAVALVSLDLVGVGAELVRLLRGRIHEEVDVVGALVAATHTHAGPAGVRSTPGSDVVTAAIVDAVGECVDRAATTAAPVRARIGTGQLPTSVATNRNDPADPIDRSLTLIRLERTDGEPVGLLWHTGVHPTVLGPDNLRYSADLPGEVRRRLRRGDEPVMFLNGPAGDVSSRFTRRGRDSTELVRLGGLLRDALPPADRALRLSPVMSAERTVIVQPADHKHEAAHLRSRTVRELQSKELKAGERRRLESVLEGLARMDGPAPSGPVEAPVQVVRLGDLVLAGVPGEAVSALSRLQPDEPDVTFLLVGYANDYIGYLTKSTVEPTYETLVSRVDAGAGVRVMATASELARESLHA
jgi:neutral ceramidase